MLIACNGCNSKIRVPDSAAGKRVKCPKCATLIRVPAADQAAEPEATGVSSPPPPPPPEEPTPQETPEEPADPEAFSTTPSSSGKKPPPIKKKRASSVDDGEDDDDDEPKPPAKKRRKYDDDDDDDDNDDDLDVSNRRSRGRSQPVNGMATTSMIMGIISVSIVAISCCCCGIYGPIVGGPVGGITAIVAIILGFMGKKPGSEGYALSGIICGAVTLVLIVVMIVLAVFVGGFAVLMDQQNRGLR